MFMNQNVDMSSLVAVVGNIDPDSHPANTYTTDWLDAAKFAKFMAILSVGTMSATSTVDAKLEQASDSSGTGAKDISGKAITQLSGAGSPSDSDQQAIINLSQEELDMSNDFTHFRLSVTVGTASSDLGAVVLGSGSRYNNADKNDAVTVVEIVD